MATVVELDSLAAIQAEITRTHHDILERLYKAVLETCSKEEHRQLEESVEVLKENQRRLLERLSRLTPHRHVH